MLSGVSMCEFRVYVIGEESEAPLAEDVIAARLEDGKLVVQDILGIRVEIEGGVIGEVDVRTETMRVYRLSLSQNFMRFVQALVAYARGELDASKVRELWAEVRERGDELVEDLSSVRGRL